MVMKNDGRISNKQKKIQTYGGDIIKCKNCKEEFSYEDVKNEVYRVNNKNFVICEFCGEQTRLK